MARKKTEAAEKWTALATLYRRGDKYEPGDDMTALAMSAPQWAQRLLEAGKVKRELVQLKVEEAEDLPPEESAEPEQTDGPDIEHPPD